jgi:hypothetical protein
MGVISKCGVVFDEGEDSVKNMWGNTKHLFKSAMKRRVLFEHPCKMHIPCLGNVEISSIEIACFV